MTTIGKPRPAWRALVAKYERPSLPRSIGQIVNTIIPYLAINCLMYFSLSVSYWLTLALAIVAAGFLTRNFIIFHDCGHGSFFRSRKANRVTGFITGVLTFMPSYYWTSEHARHHATSGDLDQRGVGDIKTLTVKEYLSLSRWQRLRYRLYRNPFVMFVLGPWYVFFIRYRGWRPDDGRRARWSAMRTNLALAAIIVAAHFTIGVKAYLMIQVPIMIFAGMMGIWLFYVQHQFEGTYWERHDKWDYLKQALQGSSFYKLPKVLQWFTGNIGFHHIHHLSPRIPNYYLQKCHESNKLFRSVREITLFASFRCLKFRLWDEEGKKLVGFNYIPEFLSRQAAPAKG